MTKALLTGLALLIAPAVWFFYQEGFDDTLKLLLLVVLIMWVALYSIFYTVFPSSRNSAWTTQLQLINLWTLSLLVVSVTGWFSSPLLFLVYLLLIVAYVVLSPLGSLGMAMSVALMFWLRVQQFRTIQDYLVLVSLALTLPIAFYLRREYLKIGEAENGILVLETKKLSKSGTLSEVLANRITKFSTLVRQPLVNIKNYTNVIGKHDLDSQTRWDYLQKIYDSATIALKELTKFEEETTGRKMHPTTTEEFTSKP